MTEQRASLWRAAHAAEKDLGVYLERWQTARARNPHAGVKPRGATLGELRTLIAATIGIIADLRNGDL